MSQRLANSLCDSFLNAGLIEASVWQLEWKTGQLGDCFYWLANWLSKFLSASLAPVWSVSCLISPSHLLLQSCSRSFAHPFSLFMSVVSSYPPSCFLPLFLLIFHFVIPPPLYLSFMPSLFCCYLSSILPVAICLYSDLLLHLSSCRQHAPHPSFHLHFLQFLPHARPFFSFQHPDLCSYFLPFSPPVPCYYSLCYLIARSTPNHGALLPAVYTVHALTFSIHTLSITAVALVPSHQEKEVWGKLITNLKEVLKWNSATVGRAPTGMCVCA